MAPAITAALHARSVITNATGKASASIASKLLPLPEASTASCLGAFNTCLLYTSDAAKAAFDLAQAKIASGAYDVVVLDEIIGSVTGGLLPLEPLLDLIDKKPPQLDLVLTGHRGKELPQLLERADLITEMVKVKHPYDSGILAKKSIDY